MHVSSDGRFAVLGGERKASIWDLEEGVCLQTFESDVDYVNGVCMTDDGRYAFVAAGNGIIRVLALDWELEDRAPVDWDEAARPCLENLGRQPTQEEITLALTRRGKPTWTESDFNELLYSLGCAGYGWLRSEGVRRELEKMARKWQEPPL
jgi:WD40 repeat protein